MRDASSRVCPRLGFLMFGLLLLAGGAWMQLMPGQSDAGMAFAQPLNGHVRHHAGWEQIPPELFGEWLRTRRLLETTAPPGALAPEETGRWRIHREGEKIYFLNPQNGTRTVIDVQNVVDKTATFTYQSRPGQGVWCQEELSLTPVAGRLLGTQQRTCYRVGENGQPEVYFYARAEVEGRRL